MENRWASSPKEKEIIIMIACMMFMIALSVDAIIPAFPKIQHDLHIKQSGNVSLIITFLFIGFSIGYFIFGILSDCKGRKKAIITGLLVYIAGSCVVASAPTLTIMLTGRFIQGLGLAAPRVVGIAITKDLFEGNKLAQMQSYILTIFIAAPIAGPFIGQLILYLFTWRMTFILFIGITTALLLWFSLRYTETLKEKRIFSLSYDAKTIIRLIKNRHILCFTLASGCVSGIHMSYLSSAQTIFQNIYHLNKTFPEYFSFLAIFLGLALFINGKVVMQYTTKKIVKHAMTGLLLLDTTGLLFITIYGGRPSLIFLMIFLSLTLFILGFLYSNLIVMAMQSLHDNSGIAAAFIGALSFFISSPISSIIGKCFDGTIVPLVFSHFLLSLSGVLFVYMSSNYSSQASNN